MATAPKDAQDLFNKFVPEGLKQYSDKIRELNAVYCFKINSDTSGPGGQWTLDCKANPPTCTEGASDRAQCTVEVSNADFKTMLGDPNVGMQLYFQGRLRVSGDLTLVMKATSIFSVVHGK